MARQNDRTFTDVLIQLGQDYRHLQQEHQRKSAKGAARRSLQTKMQETAERFERTLHQWVQDPEQREAWIRYLYDRASPPDVAPVESPPLFKGVTEVGSRVEVRRAGDGAYDVLVDGSIESHERIPWHLDPDMIEPVRIGDHNCREVTDAPPEALRALEEFKNAPNSQPPWRWAGALYSDGLIDENFGLTVRGERILSKAPRGINREALVTYGVMVADAARARLFILSTGPGEYDATMAPLVEVSQSTRPDQRAPDRDVFANSRPGLRRDNNTAQHGMSERRQSHRHETEQRFATEVVEEAEQVWAEHDVSRVIIAASPTMLGVLRPILARKHKAPKRWSVDEVARDLTWLTPPMLHDALAAAGLLPPRGRRPSVIQTPGLPT